MTPSELTRTELEVKYILLIEALLKISRYDEYAAYAAPKIAEDALTSVGIQVPTNWSHYK